MLVKFTRIENFTQYVPTDIYITIKQNCSSNSLKGEKKLYFLFILNLKEGSKLFQKLAVRLREQGRW